MTCQTSTGLGIWISARANCNITTDSSQMYDTVRPQSSGKARQQEPNKSEIAVAANIKVQ